MSMLIEKEIVAIKFGNPDLPCTCTQGQPINPNCLRHGRRRSSKYMEHKVKRRPTYGLTRSERLALYRSNLIESLPALVQRRHGEKREPLARSDGRTVRLAIGRVVSEIRRVSKEIGPVRPVISQPRNHD